MLSGELTPLRRLHGLAPGEEGGGRVGSTPLLPCAVILAVDVCTTTAVAMESHCTSVHWPYTTNVRSVAP